MGNSSSKKLKKNKDDKFSKKNSARKSSKRKTSKQPETTTKTVAKPSQPSLKITKVYKVPSIREEPKLEHTEEPENQATSPDSLSIDQQAAKNPSKNNLLIINDSTSETSRENDQKSMTKSENEATVTQHKTTLTNDESLESPQDLKFQDNPLYQKSIEEYIVESYSSTDNEKPVVRKKHFSTDNYGATIVETFFESNSNLSEVFPSKIEFPNSPTRGSSKIDDFHSKHSYKINKNFTGETRSLYNYNDDVEIRQRPLIRRLSSRESTELQRKVFYSRMLNGSSQFDVSDSISIVGIDSLDDKKARESVTELLNKIETFSKTKTYSHLKLSEEIKHYDLNSYPENLKEFAVKLEEIEDKIKNMSNEDIHLYFPTLKDDLHNIWQKIYNIKVEIGENGKKQELIDRVKNDLDKLNKRYLMRK